MTNEALKYLDELYQDQSEGYSIDIANGGQPKNEMEKWLESMRIALEALEKQISKEVTNKFTDLDEEGFEVIFGGCPNCKMEVNFDDNEYCPYCGQRLEWERYKRYSRLSVLS